ISGKGTSLRERIGQASSVWRDSAYRMAGANSRRDLVGIDEFRPPWIVTLPREQRQKRRPPCRHGGLESREETPKEGICGRAFRTAAISSLTPTIARTFFIKMQGSLIVLG